MSLHRDVLNLHGVHDSLQFGPQVLDLCFFVSGELLVLALVLVFDSHLEFEQLVLDVNDHLLIFFLGLGLGTSALGLSWLLSADVLEFILDVVIVVALGVV